MSIIKANENDSSIVSGLPLGLYYYHVSPNQIENATYLGYAPTIESITFNPFINENDLNLIEVNFDTDKYGKPNGIIPKCYRIATNPTIDYELKKLDLFPSMEDMYKFNDEIKLYVYPFRYFLLTDFINPPLLIKPELVKSLDGKLSIRVITSPCSQMGKYAMYVEGYKKDYDGNLEGVVNTTALMLPVSSSAYAQFLSTSASSFNTGVSNALLENDLSLKQGVESSMLSQRQTNIGNAISAVSSLASLNLGRIASSVGGAVVNTLMNNATSTQNRTHMKEQAELKEGNIITSANAQVSDMLSTPRVLKSTGNDTVFNLSNSRKKVMLIEYEVNNIQRPRIKQIFQRYGYVVNKYDKIRPNARESFTYIKTHVCNIRGEKIPHSDLSELKEIFNSGITFWNKENGVSEGDYAVRNNETYK